MWRNLNNLNLLSNRAWRTVCGEGFNKHPFNLKRTAKIDSILLAGIANIEKLCPVLPL